MHAVVMREFGTADVLRPGEVPDPTARRGWVTVRLHASALNWHDVLVRQGRYASPLPHIIGADGAGVRTDTGEPVVVLPSLNWGDHDEAPAADWEILGDHTPGPMPSWSASPPTAWPQTRRLELVRGRGAAVGGRDDLSGAVRPRAASPG